jgi:4-hydroxy-3-polyprenylbenzoate decarboxylase
MYGFIRGKKATLVKSLTNDIYIPHDVDFVIEGWVDPEKTMIEGMFGDHTGYYTLKEPYPYLDVTSITSKKEPLFYATVVGKPPLEDKYMGYATERIFLPLLQTQAPQLVDYRMPENGVFHNLILAKIAPSYPGHSLQIMHALWGVGQMSFVKHALFIDDKGPNLKSNEEVARYILNRITPDTILISKGVLDALDHSAPKALIGGKLGIDATGDTVTSSIDVIDDANLFAKVQTRMPSIIALKQYFTDTPNPITVIQYKKEISAKEHFEKLKTLSNHLKIIVFVDEKDNDVANAYMIVWRVTNNIDALRDIWIENEMFGIDGTNKNELDGFNREWPDDVVCNTAVIKDLKKRGFINLSDEEITQFGIIAPEKI